MGSERTLLLIADIGGYTDYMRVHRMSLAHAEVNTARLLEAVIDAAGDFDLIEIEGDAAFLSREADTLDGDATAAAMTEAVVGMHRAFHRERITWDEPIQSVADIEALPWRPRMLNLKPARFGSVRALFDAYDYCAANGIGAYGGGMFEQGPGRGQLQYLASLFHPGTPNDVAPAGYNLQSRSDELPRSPLAPSPHPTGFRWGTYDGRRSIREAEQGSQ